MKKHAESGPQDRAENRVFVLGVDGASWNALERLWDRDLLPGFKGLVENGCHARLNNLGCHKSPAIWTSMATGVKPQDHGIGDFVSWRWRNPMTGELINSEWINRIYFRGLRMLLNPLGFRRMSPSSTMRRAPAIWNFLSAHGRSVGVVNWWATFPAEHVDGCIVSDHCNFERIRLRSDLGSIQVTSDEVGSLPGLAHPRKLQDALTSQDHLSASAVEELCTRFVQLTPQLREALNSAETFRRGDPMSVLKFSRLQDEFAVTSTEYIMREYGQPDFLTTYLGGLDAISHYFWKYLFPEEFPEIDSDEMETWGEALPEYYAYCEETLTRLVDQLDEDTTIFVVSDHGFHAVRPPGSEGANSGTHTEAPDGVFMASGPRIAEAKDVGRLSVLDLLPTWLHCLGLPVPEHLPGSVVRDVFSDSAEVRYDQSKGDSDGPGNGGEPTPSSAEDLVEDRLRALGYID